MHTIEVDTVRAVEWSDSSIGCPQPGEAYLQVITRGHKTTLRVAGKLHFVHEANGRAFVCKRTKSVGGVTTQLELVWGPAAIEAREDLAGRLGVDLSLVMVASAQGTTFSRIPASLARSLASNTKSEISRAGSLPCDTGRAITRTTPTWTA